MTPASLSLVAFTITMNFTVLLHSVRPMPSLTSKTKQPLRHRQGPENYFGGYCSALASVLLRHHLEVRLGLREHARDRGAGLQPFEIGGKLRTLRAERLDGA